jgi:photosystem II stability/assembly factor-like uncharacterized protein
MTKRILLMVLLISGILFSCKKEQPSILNSNKVFTGRDIRINDIRIISDSLWVLCGGNRNMEGYFLQSNDRGASWSATRASDKRSIYCMEINSTGFGMAGGDFLDLWTTGDFGKTWNYYWLGDQVPFNEEDRPAVRDIVLVNDSIWQFCGGENLGEGVIYRTTDSGEHWQFVFHQNEFRSALQHTSGETIVGGHGKVLRYQDNPEQASYSSFEEGFITSMTTAGNGSITACTFEGKIIHSADGGLTWIESLNLNDNIRRRVNWNSLIQSGSTIVCTGTFGHIGISQDEGVSWRIARISEDSNLITGAIDGKLLIAGDTEGNIHFISLTD